MRGLVGLYFAIGVALVAPGGSADGHPADDLPAARRTFETLVSLRNLHGGPPSSPTSPWA